MNLGALCRTAEVWRLQALVLPASAVLQDRDFRKGAVSADQWQPLAVCTRSDLPDWIAQQQRQQVAVVALTRHPRRSPCPILSFPGRQLCC